MFFQYPLLQSKDYNISISYSSVKIKMDNPFKSLHNTYQSILRVQQMLEWKEILLRQVPPGGAMSCFSYLIVLIPKIFFLPSSVPNRNPTENHYIQDTQNFGLAFAALAHSC